MIFHEHIKLKPSEKHVYSLNIIKVLITFSGFFFCAMYSAIVVSLLSVSITSPQPQTLEDLAKKFTQHKIYLIKGTQVDDFVQHSTFYEALKPRIEYYPYETNPQFYDDMIEKVALGTHVIIDVRGDTLPSQTEIKDLNFLAKR